MLANYEKQEAIEMKNTGTIRLQVAKQDKRTNVLTYKNFNKSV